MPEFEKSTGFKMKGFSGFVNSPMKQKSHTKPEKESDSKYHHSKATKDYTSPKAASYKREKQITKEHNTEAERGNPTGNTCMTCGEPRSKHVNNYPHAFKAYTGKPSQSPNKFIDLAKGAKDKLMMAATGGALGDKSKGTDRDSIMGKK